MSWARMRLGAAPHDPARVAAVPLLGGAAFNRARYNPGAPLHTDGLVGWGQCVTGLPEGHNDEIGDCVPNGAAAALRVLSAAGGREIIVPDDTVVDWYKRFGGYDPARPETDQGMQLLDTGHTLRLPVAGRP